MVKKGSWMRRTLACFLCIVMAAGCCLPAFASAEDETTYVDDNKILHIYGNYTAAYTDDESYTSIMVESGADLNADITYDVPVTVLRGVGDKASGEIKAGTFNQAVTNRGLISGGTFHGDIDNETGTVTNGVFYSRNFDNSRGYLRGGEFHNTTLTVYRIGIFGGDFHACTIKLGGVGAIYGGTYDKDCSLVFSDGAIGITDGTFECDITTSKPISGGTFNGAVTNNGSIVGGTFNGKLTNNGSISGGNDPKTSVKLNGETVNNGSISGAIEYGEGFSISGNDRLFVSVNLYDATGKELQKTVTDVFKAGATLTAGIADYEKQARIAGKWQKVVGDELTDIQPEDVFARGEVTNLAYTPVWQLTGSILEVVGDWDGVTPAAPSYSGSYTTVKVCHGATLTTSATWMKRIVNEGTIVGGTYTGEEFINNSDLSGATISVDSIVNTGKITDSAFVRRASSDLQKVLTITNNEPGTILSSTYSSKVVVSEQSTAINNIAVPVNVYDNSLDEEPTVINDKPNYHKNIKEWLKAQYPQDDVFSHNTGIAIDGTETFRELRVYNFLRGYTYRFEWEQQGGGYQAKFYVRQGGVDQEVGNVTVTSKTVDATCLEDGETVYTATANYDGKVFTEDHEVEGAPATGHRYDKDHITWTWDENHETASAELECLNCHQPRVEQATVSKQVTDASCEAAGNTKYTATVSDVEGQSYTDEVNIAIEKLPHEYAEEAPAWVWSEDNSSASMTFVCTKCAESTKVDATVSKIVKAATCAVAGEIFYEADLTFNGQSYHDEKLTVLDLTAHTYKDPTWTWDGTNATATFTCTVCKEATEQRTAVATKQTTREPSCTSEGTTTYTATVHFNNRDYTGTRTEPIDKVAHIYGTTPTWTWDGYKTATATFKCIHCTDRQTVKAEITKAVKKAATCTEDGTNVYTAKATYNGQSYTNEKNETVAKHHVDANNDKTCDVCGENLDPAQGCDHICHKDGFAGFVWKILCFFFKLFKINPTCKCGVAHY